MTASKLGLNSSVRQWVVGYPQLGAVFDDYRINYCCAGSVSLQEACWRHHLDPRAVLARLIAKRDTCLPDGLSNWSATTLTELCDHIQMVHHTFLRRELPRLTRLLDVVLQIHGNSHREQYEVRKLLNEVYEGLLLLMLKEERVIFPAIRRVEKSGTHFKAPSAPIGHPICAVEVGHEDIGIALSRIRELTREYSIPQDGTIHYVALLGGLRDLETETSQHVRMENHILFPRALELEARLSH
jgi:regulator of cell morphogenesis and NO signaling